MQEPTYHDHGIAPLGRHAALLPAVLHDQLAAETGVDPAALPELPELPHWLTAAHDDRPVMTRDMDTGTLPVVPPQWESATDDPTQTAAVLHPVPAVDDPAEVPA